MGVLLGLGDVQLAPAGGGDRLRQRRLRPLLGEGDRVGPLFAVGGHRRDFEGRPAGAAELVEVRLGQRPGHLARPVGAEVDEDRDVAGGGAVVVADHGRQHELVGLPVGVGVGDRLGGARRLLALGVDDRVVGELHPLPAGVAVHRVVAAADGADAARGAQPRLQLGEVLLAPRRRRVAAVGEGVEDDVGDPFLGGQLDDRLEVLPARVDAAVGDQPEQVQPPARAFARARAGGDQRLVFVEGAVGDRAVDAGQVLPDDRSGAEVQVADLGVAHLADRQADVGALGGELGVRVARPEVVEDRRVGERDRVARARAGRAPSRRG